MYSRTPSHRRPESPSTYPVQPGDPIGLGLHADASRSLIRFLSRRFCDVVSNVTGRGDNRWGGEKGGALTTEAPRDVVLARTAVQLFNPATLSGAEWPGADCYLEARFSVGLPAQGQSIEGSRAVQLLTAVLPRSVTAAFQWASLGRDQERTWVNMPCVEDQAYLRAQLA